MSYTFNDDTVSDLHKDAYGFRPSANFWDWWESASSDEKQAKWDDLCETMEAEVAREKEMEREAIREFEVKVARIIDLGARTRKVALRWMMEGSEANGDWEYFCYLNGLPYHYFKKAA